MAHGTSREQGGMLGKMLAAIIAVCRPGLEQVELDKTPWCSARCESTLSCILYVVRYSWLIIGDTTRVLRTSLATVLMRRRDRRCTCDAAPHGAVVYLTSASPVSGARRHDLATS